MLHRKVVLKNSGNPLHIYDGCIFKLKFNLLKRINQPLTVKQRTIARLLQMC